MATMAQNTTLESFEPAKGIVLFVDRGRSQPVTLNEFVQSAGGINDEVTENIQS